MVTLSVEDLVVQYQSRDGTIKAVDNVSFSLSDNESMGIVGESACGKSTLGLAITRSASGGRIVSGDVLLDGKSLVSLTEEEFTKKIRWKQISMVFQGAMNSLDPVFPIKQQFEEILKSHGWTNNHQETIEKTLALVGLDLSVLGKFPHELSGGMKQRVVIAMALLLRPKVVIADEPTTALDVLTQAQVLNILKRLKMEGMSIILISHDLGIVSEIADRVAIMYAGQVVEFGTLEEVYSDPKHPYTQALLKSVPKINDAVDLISLKGNPPSLVNLPVGCRFYERCPKAMDKCKTMPPKIKTKSGYTLCWLYE